MASSLIRQEIASVLTLAHDSLDARWYSITVAHEDRDSLSKLFGLTHSNFVKLFDLAGFLKPFGKQGKLRFQQKEFQSFLNSYQQLQSLEITQVGIKRLSYNQFWCIRIGILKRDSPLTANHQGPINSFQSDLFSDCWASLNLMVSIHSNTHVQENKNDATTVFHQASTRKRNDAGQFMMSSLTKCAGIPHGRLQSMGKHVAAHLSNMPFDLISGVWFHRECTGMANQGSTSCEQCTKARFYVRAERLPCLFQNDSVAPTDGDLHKAISLYLSRKSDPIPIIHLLKAASCDYYQYSQANGPGLLISFCVQCTDPRELFVTTQHTGNKKRKMTPVLCQNCAKDNSSERRRQLRSMDPERRAAQTAAISSTSFAALCHSPTKTRLHERIRNMPSWIVLVMMIAA